MTMDETVLADVVASLEAAWVEVKAEENKAKTLGFIPQSRRHLDLLGRRRRAKWLYSVGDFRPSEGFVKMI